MSSSPSTRGVFRPTTTPLPREDRLPVPPTDGPREFCLTVDYPARVAVGTLQTVRVELAPLEPLDRLVDSGRPMLPEPLPVRLIVPGALVTPPEQGLDPSPFVPVATEFYVTPLAIGQLPQARAELLRDGRLDVVAMPMRCHGWLTPWLLAAMTFLIPILLHQVASAGPVAFQHELTTWLPGLTANAAASKLVSSVFALLRHGHLSFIAFLALAAATVWMILIRCPLRTTLRGEPFTISPPVCPKTPPSYLTPISTPEIGVVPARGT